jgi:HPr kinase/phosphorylase
MGDFVMTMTIAELLQRYGRRLGLVLIEGEGGLDRTINNSDSNRPSLALTGFVNLFSFDQVQILGNHEIEYLHVLDSAQRSQALDIIYQFDMPCVVVTGNSEIPDELYQVASRCQIPLFQTEFSTAKFNHLLHFYLDDIFAPHVTVHGTLVDVHGVGLLFTGRSAIGKSEVGLDLVERGHRLVADDTVIITRKAQGVLVGQSPEMLQDHMEIRGIGIINMKRLFGIRGIRKQKRVEVVVDLVDWKQEQEFDRTGLDDLCYTILGIEVPEIQIPLVPGKNITVIAEAIALNHLLRLDGYHSAKEFNRNLVRTIKEKKSPGSDDPTD